MRHCQSACPVGFIFSFRKDGTRTVTIADDEAKSIAWRVPSTHPLVSYCTRLKRPPRTMINVGEKVGCLARQPRGKRRTMCFRGSSVGCLFCHAVWENKCEGHVGWGWTHRVYLGCGANNILTQVQGWEMLTRSWVLDFGSRFRQRRQGKHDWGH